MHRLELSDSEIGAIESLLSEIAKQYHTVEDTDFLHKASLYAHELPQRVRGFLNDFKLLEPSGVCVIAGYPVDDEKIGRTPEHWKVKQAVSPTLDLEFLLVLYGSLLGDVFGWSTQQDGFLVHDLMPIKGHEQEQLGSGSEQKLWWHTEDAFHLYKGDYVGLMCLRNPDEVATTVASIDDLQISAHHARTLFEPNFTIRPDESHLLKNKHSGLNQTNDAGELLAAAYEQIHQMNSNPRKQAVLFGDPQSPYMCLDPYFMDLDQLDAESRQAFQALSDAIEANLKGLVLYPGDTCFIDNFRAVHGRNPFKARFDGNDRWLKRINVTRDLRKSRSARPSADSRILY
ncbi:MAG TPA: guanitoxin biosynthesis L-enduracididine beta-hydroxylase GntD [Herpetosiphonaceae bacterium]